MNRWLVTGGAGFIGGNFVLKSCAEERAHIVNLDALTYAGNRQTLNSLEDNPLHTFVHGDIRDRQLVQKLLEDYRPNAIIHFAAESHVDRSIDEPATFIQTNVVGTLVLLEAAEAYWRSLPEARADRFRFLNISTDEVFGELTEIGSFSETSAYRPNSPYAASKAAADHLVRAFSRTYDLPTLTSHSSNNYGPYQFPEKLIPLMILKGLAGEPMPIYGDGLYVRDWIFVEDHCSALWTILEQGEPGSVYAVGGGDERTNLEIVRTLCEHLDAAHPEGAPHERLISFVKDRRGHDRRYAMDSSRLRDELGWRPRTDITSGLERTVDWYLEHSDWYQPILDRHYRGERLGLAHDS